MGIKGPSAKLQAKSFKGEIPGSAGVSPASSNRAQPRGWTRRRDASAPRIWVWSFPAAGANTPFIACPAWAKRERTRSQKRPRLLFDGPITPDPEFGPNRDTENFYRQ